jgi:hypothetical protein
MNESKAEKDSFIQVKKVANNEYTYIILTKTGFINKMR